MRARRRLFLGLGSNIGDRRDILVRTRHALEQELGPVLAASKIYETAAWGKIDQSDFLNQVIILGCKMTQYQVLRAILRTEAKLGRVRQDKWGARSIDVDLLFYGELVYESSDLTIPHPFISQRRFILAPLAEIAPDFIHPTLNISMRSLLQKCEDQSAIKVFEP